MNFRIRRSALLVSLGLGLLVGCGQQRTEAELLASARSAIDRQEFRAAYVDLQNALLLNDRSSELRFAMGRLLAESGNPSHAAVEFRKALDLGHPEATVVPPLAKALFKAGQMRELMTEFAARDLKDPAADATLKTVVAAALFSQGKRSEAKALLDAVLLRQPDHAPARVLSAQIAADEGQPQQALNLLDALLETQPGDADAWRARGDVLQYGLREPVRAIDSYVKAIEARPADLDAYRALIFLYLARGDVKSAEQRQASMRKLFPSDVQVAYFAAHIKALKGELTEARTILEQVRKVAPNDRWVLFLGGVIDLSMRSWVQAEQQLSRLLRIHPEFAYARILLARLALRTGEPNQAIEVLQPLLTLRGNPSAQVLSLAAEANLMAGNAEQASRLFDAAGQTGTDSSEARMGPARAALARGDDQTAAAELVRLTQVETGTAPDLALISLRLRRGELAAAGQAIDGLITKQPKDPLGFRLRAELALRQGKGAEARAAFETCLKLEPRYFDAVAGLAALDMADQQPDAAEQRLRTMAEGPDGMLSAQLALAQLLMVRQRPDAVEPLLRTAVEQHPEDPRGPIALADHLLGQNAARRAQQVLAEADRKLPGQPTLMLKLAQAQLASQDDEQAAATYGKILSVRPGYLPALLGLGQLQASRKDWTGAAGSYRRALQVRPDEMPAILGLVQAEVAQSRYREALESVAALSQRHPESPIPALLRGDVALARGNPAEGAARYRESLAMPGAASTMAAHAYTSLRRAGQRDAAEALGKSWLQRHPQDVVFLSEAGKFATVSRDLPEAETRYRAVLAIDATNLEAMNNLAWLLAEQGKPGGVPLAEAALKQRPNAPAILDTLAHALAAEGQIDRAIQVQQQAVKTAARFTPDYHLSLARLFIRAGKTDEARTELERLSSLGTTYARHAQVDELLKAAGR